ncbi:hypothetical protein [Anabaena azotica]|uniref:Uncharacterized protein n=1 Tax=Anabaena azotica FACHB-119 TaxID=947527 RepID=A0ABR8DAJ3_9NOST|nr:hypothetical protein [Anabaena azotica]MBD2503166.1 hypothetical protein [Anabaena azotica FACHB-119]
MDAETVANNNILAPLAQVIDQLVDYGDPLEDPITGQALKISEVKVAMPLELRVETKAAAQVALKASAPTQKTETTIMPVFHRLTLRILTLLALKRRSR